MQGKGKNQEDESRDNVQMPRKAGMLSMKKERLGTRKERPREKYPVVLFGSMEGYG